MVSYGSKIGQMLIAGILWSQLASVLPAQQRGAADQRDRPKDDTAVGAQCTLSPETLLSKEWRLYSGYFEVQPAAGYPFRFLNDGSVESNNLGNLKQWQIEEDGTVTLGAGDGREVYRFRFDKEYCVLTAYDCEGKRSVPVLLGPKGTDFFGYLTKRCPQRFRRVRG